MSEAHYLKNEKSDIRIFEVRLYSVDILNFIDYFPGSFIFH